MMPPFNADEYMHRVNATLRPLNKRHWMRKQWHKWFMYSGWRRLIAKKDQEIADLRDRVLHCMGSCSDKAPSFALLVAKEMKAAEEWSKERDRRMATGLYCGTGGEAVEVVGLVDAAPLPNAGAKGCADCKGPLGPKYYQGVPNMGDLCLECHHTQFGSPL